MTQVSWLFEKNPRSDSILPKIHPKRRQELNQLVKILRLARVQGIQEKFSQIGDYRRFLEHITELEFAKLLIGKRKSITILEDSYMGGGRPDILTKGCNFEEYWEISEMTSGFVLDFLYDRLYPHAKKFLNEHGKHFIINIYLGPSLVNDEPDYQLRNKQEHILKEAFVDLDRYLRRHLGEITNGSQFLTTEFEIEFLEHKQVTESILGSINFFFLSDPMAPIVTDEESERRKQQIQRKIAFKNKRNRYSPNEKSIFNYIAIKYHPFVYNTEHFYTALFGEVKKLALNFMTEKVKALLRSSWEKYLRKMHLIPHQSSCCDCTGLYFNEEKMKDISGVAFFEGGQADLSSPCEFYPNPFCDQEINNPKITLNITFEK